MKLEKFTLGVGDRFGREGVAQLAALQKAARAGVEIIPVWNKSNREHTLIGSTPADTRSAAEAAVKAAGTTSPLSSPMEREHWAQLLWLADEQVKAGEPDEVIRRLTGLKVASFQTATRDDLLAKAAELKAKAGKYLL